MDSNDTDTALPWPPRGELRRAFLALQFLTKLPTPSYPDFEPDELSRSAVWFPAVGLVVGAFVAAAAWLGALSDPWIGAFLGVLAWTWVTGALHLDGLGDLADGLGASHRDPERLREVMSDPRTGIFAVVTIILQIMAKFVALHALVSASQFWPILVLAGAARLGPLYWVKNLPPLGSGSGERFAWHVESRMILGWSAGLAVFALFAPVLLVCIPAVIGWRRFLLGRIGGQTGDALGAGIEIVESVGLMALAIAASAA